VVYFGPYRSDAIAAKLAVVAPLTDLRAGVATGWPDRWLTALADRATEHLAGDLLDLVWLRFGRVNLGPSR
jgi:hypothetical protein